MEEKSLVAIGKSVIGDSEVNSVNARELHSFLESKQQFADWIKSKVIDNAFFKKEVDWIELDLSLRNSMKQKGGKNRKDYALTIDTAKKVAMAEQTAKGEEVRDYFIRCEKALKEVVQLDGGNTITLKELIDIKLLTTKYLAEMLNYSEASTLQLVHNVHKEHNISTLYLPQYVESQRVAFSLSDLLKKNNIEMTAKSLNNKLLLVGILEEKERRSTSSKTGVKKFKALSAKGLKYGHNDVSPFNKNEVSPRYYEDSFMDMFELVNPSYKAA
jgi:phage anti-repressor protein